MDLLKELPPSGLDALRNEFSCGNRGGVTVDEFFKVLASVCRSYHTTMPLTEDEARRVFERIDVFGTGRISWEDFSMHAIDSLGEQTHQVATVEKEPEVTFHPYHVEQRMEKVHGGHVREVRALPKDGKVMVVSTDFRGNYIMNLCEGAANLPLFGTIQNEFGPLLSWEFIPHSLEGTSSDSIACSYTGGYVRFFSTAKKNHLHLEELQYIRLGDNQNCLHWIPFTKHLAMGSHQGVMTMWDIQCQTMLLRRRLSRRPITALRSHKSLLYIATLDVSNSVRCFDLEHNTVRYTFSDHSVGGVMQFEMDDYFLYSVGIEPTIVQRSLSPSASSPVCLHDKLFPHKGRITALYRRENSPFLVSGDAYGVLKFWDIRVGACVQTVKTGNDINDSDAVKLPKVRCTTNSPFTFMVRSISHIDRLGKLTVVTTRELIVLSSEAFKYPGLVDDRQNCRFVFSPNSEVFLTIHDFCAKLWCSVTGRLIRCSDRSITKCDITSCCLVESLRRQAVLGTMGGEVKVLSVSTLQQTVDLTEVVQQYVCGAEIISLHTISNYRRRDLSFVFIATSSSLVLAPIQPNPSLQSVTVFNGILENFMQPNQIIKATAVTESEFAVATSDRRVYVVSYTDAVYLMHTFQMSVVVEAILIQSVLTLRGHSGAGEEYKSHSSENVIAFFSDLTGVVHIAMISRSAPTEGSCVGIRTARSGRRGSYVSPGEIVGSWLPARSDSWIGNNIEENALMSSTAYYSRRTRTHSIVVFGSKEHQTRSHIFHRERERLNLFPVDMATSSAPFILYLQHYNVLVTLDEEGCVRLWDVAGVVAYCLGGIQVSPPVLIVSWQTNERDIIFFGAASHPTLHLPLLLTATGDRQVILWSTDGVALGSFSTGREVDDASGGRRFGLRPYELASADMWKMFVAYTESMRVRAPVRRRGHNSQKPSEVTLAPPYIGDKVLEQQQQQQLSKRARSPSAFSVLTIDSRASLEQSIATHYTCDLKIHMEGDAKEKEEEYKERSVSIVKPVYQSLVTRTDKRFSLGQAGGVSLPPLNMLAIHRKGH